MRRVLTRHWLPIGRLLLGAALLLAPGPSGVAVASSSRGRPSGVSAEDDHASYCGCGPRCRRETCCCGPAAPKPPPPEPTPSPPRADEAPTGATPACVRGGPCHDPGTPATPAVELIGKAMASDRASPLFGPAAGDTVPPCPVDASPRARRAGIERPPRGASPAN